MSSTDKHPPQACSSALCLCTVLFYRCLLSDRDNNSPGRHPKRNKRAGGEGTLKKEKRNNRPHSTVHSKNCNRAKGTNGQLNPFKVPLWASTSLLLPLYALLFLLFLLFASSLHFSSFVIISLPFSLAHPGIPPHSTSTVHTPTGPR